ncbi:GGDEF domain-containing protein [Jiella mangrovi]|uniref:diguanylate cyclase n=1 Tax=Jiella mangrovi TaxID=2821407 RepID=A0ABS4BNP7_9HYPH|nr:GGDEF domain-containing protein [Jiella mangrovi]MBP0617841.1 GGDEF domain-containing protein [Jiella mangrovi]
MNVNIQLVLLLATGTCLIAGAAMYAEWRESREPAAAWWSSAFLFSVVGAVVFFMQNFPALDSSVLLCVSNALFLASYGAILAGASVFLGRRPSLLVFCLPIFLWLAFWCFCPAASDFDTRVVFMSIATASISGASAWLGFSSRANNLVRVFAIVLSLRAGFFFVRAIWAAGALGPISDGARSFGFQIVIIEGLWTSVLLGYLMFAMLREKRESSLVKLAETDFLTGASNRRAFHVAAQRAVARSSAKSPVSLLMLDLDNFKQLNDAFGHSFGDSVLQQFATIVRGRIGPSDLFARLGGEEFAVALIGQQADQAAGLAEQIRQAFEQTMLERGVCSVSATVSIGLATTGQAETVGELLAFADDALYEAKAKGRNRIERADGSRRLASAPGCLGPEFRLSA